ncbi:hypothetical protein RISK_001878 [Rhodopirellula islandica]|uniref:Uncharacterized protein n=1 Tax=Rhodopirellula islandica TaxID=595434 RepID=A0A0J1BHL8_RHOIS|nr:hypothetical protein [Rhodopirellula islandica]KLU06027.1 hypothetical protein RISK_001878 [Rhodopirellula islandica]
MKLSPELEAMLSELATLCCDALEPSQTLNHARVESLCQNLSTSGWKRHSRNSPPLSVVLKDRAKEQRPEITIHRGGELDAVVGKIQSVYDDVSRMQASSDEESPAGTAMPPRTSLS